MNILFLVNIHYISDKCKTLKYNKNIKKVECILNKHRDICLQKRLRVLLVVISGRKGVSADIHL